MFTNGKVQITHIDSQFGKISVVHIRANDISLSSYFLCCWSLFFLNFESFCSDKNREKIKINAFVPREVRLSHQFHAMINKRKLEYGVYVMRNITTNFMATVYWGWKRENVDSYLIHRWHYQWPGSTGGDTWKPKQWWMEGNWASEWCTWISNQRSWQMTDQE